MQVRNLSCPAPRIVVHFRPLPVDGREFGVQLAYNSKYLEPVGGSFSRLYLNCQWCRCGPYQCWFICIALLSSWLWTKSKAWSMMDCLHFLLIINSQNNSFL